MFAGHYAVGYLLKKRFREVPLWQLFIGVQAVDILAFLLILAKVERIAYFESVNPFLRTTIEYVPFSHSLAACSLFALVVLLVFSRFKSRAFGYALSIGVLSHWFLDFIVHTPDLPLVFDKFKVGLGLWRFPLAALVVELAFFVYAGLSYLKGSGGRLGHAVLIVLLVVGYSALFFVPEAEASPAAAAAGSLALFTVFTALAFWGDRREEQ